MAVAPEMALIAVACEQAGYGPPAPEYQFALPLRKWRFDLAWPALRVAFEREGFGAGGAPGRHRRIAGYSADCEKYNAAALAGWLVIRATPPMIRSGKALTALLAALKAMREQGAPR